MGKLFPDGVGKLFPDGQPQLAAAILALVDSNARFAVGNKFNLINRHLPAASAVGQFSATWFQ